MATIRICELHIARTLDRDAVTRVKGGRMMGVYTPLFPRFPAVSNQQQHVAVSAVQLADNFGFGTINQALGISVAANQR